MSSKLRQNINFEAAPAVTSIRRSPSPPSKKQKMSLSQTYMVASSARAKLGKEAMRPDHNLRLLVGHANLLDTLMVELRDAEREQDAWFNASVRKAAREEEPKHIRWADTVVEESEEMDTDSDSSDSDSDLDESEYEIAVPHRLVSSPVTISSELSEDEDEMGYMDYEDSPDLALVRTDSHPPELVDDSDSEDEGATPTTPPQAVLEFSEKDILSLTIPSKQQPSTTGFVHTLQENQAPLIAAY